MTNAVGHVFICFLVTYWPSLGEVLDQVFCLFFLLLGYLLFLIGCMVFFTYSGYESLIEYTVEKISPILWEWVAVSPS